MQLKLCLLQLLCWPPRKGSRGKAPSFRNSAQACLNFENPAPVCSPQTDNKSSRAGESWKQLLHAPGPAPTRFPMTAAGKINTAALWTLQYHERGLHHRLGGLREGLAASREDAVYPHLKLTMPGRLRP